MPEPNEQNQNNTTPWHQGVEGVDQEMVGHWQNKGWDANDPAKIAVAASKAHRDAEKLIGSRVDHDMVAVPRALDKGDWNAVWTKLGKPAKADEYDFKGIAHKDGTALEDNFINSMREAAFKANLPKSAATDVVKAVVDFYEGKDTSAAGDKALKIAAERKALATDWQTTPEQLAGSPHMKMAQQAAAALGVDVEAVNALEGQIGYAAVMKMFRSIAGKIGEDKWFTGEGKGQGLNGMLTVEQAVARKGELKADQTWVRKYLDGDTAARQEMGNLDTIITNAQRR